ncbi:MAG: hypothetical protein P8X87_06855, partial [Candidatus Bathyarchaeota archaeon]
IFSLQVMLLPIVKAEGSIMNPIDELLPPVICDPGHDPLYPLQEPFWYYGNSWKEKLNETGFLEGKAIQFYKRFSYHSDMSVEFYVYKFSDSLSAEQYFNKEFNKSQSEDNYVEITIAGAFARKYDYETQEIGISLGIIRNIVFTVKIYTINIVEDPTDQLIEFTKLEQEQISSAKIIPEFSSPVCLLLIIFVSFTIIVRLKTDLSKTKRKTQ